MRCLITLILLAQIHFIHAQDNWDIRDPVDLVFIDLADNKLILYNGIGVGLLLWLNQEVGNHDRPWTVEMSTGLSWEYGRDPLSKIQDLAVRFIYPIRPRLDMGIESTMGRVHDIQVTTFHVGFRAIFTWYFIVRKKFSLAYDNGVGPNLFIDPFPYGGSRFNFSTFYGLKAFITLRSEMSLSLGLKNTHISNAGLYGKDKNPALDGLGFHVGWSFYPSR